MKETGGFEETRRATGVGFIELNAFLADPHDLGASAELGSAMQSLHKRPTKGTVTIRAAPITHPDRDEGGSDGDEGGVGERIRLGRRGPRSSARAETAS
ncbi:hypothetical protein [Sorangium sp. So ce861]|uniref:hypothetical protein n=1 Tax=Sorangium sp. So ce861 TaxID=3133323 RepID=UPI003F5DF3AA